MTNAGHTKKDFETDSPGTMHHIYKKKKAGVFFEDCSYLIRTGAPDFSSRNEAFRACLPLSSANSLNHNEPTANFFQSFGKAQEASSLGESFELIVKTVAACTT